MYEHVNLLKSVALNMLVQWASLYYTVQYSTVQYSTVQYTVQYIPVSLLRSVVVLVVVPGAREAEASLVCVKTLIYLREILLILREKKSLSSNIEL